MNRNSIQFSRRHLIFFSIILMLDGVLFSRALLSAGMALFIICTLVHRNVLAQLKEFFASPFLWAMTLLFFIPLVTGIWSTDIEKWTDIIRIKIPLLVMPLCFARFNYFNKEDWQKVAVVFIILVLIGVAWSTWHYIQNMDQLNLAYLKAQTLHTPLENDHVRFSLLVSIALFTVIYLLVKQYRLSLLIIAILFTVYLHLLAVRTGLLCFYSGIFIFILWLLFKRANKLRSAILLLLLLLLPVIAYFSFPTFKNRISYLRYDFSFVKRDLYLEGSNDGKRMISINAGWKLMNQHPVSGVGFGNIEKEVNQWYRSNYQQMVESDKILPSSEFMIYGTGAGWPGLILFAGILALPFFIKPHNGKIMWWILNLSIGLSYLFDIGLEVQYGVFIHAFTLLWWHNWLEPEKEKQTGER